jgi:hypothetical protein
MRGVKGKLRLCSIRPVVVGGLILLGACPITRTAHAQNPANSAYSLATTSVTIVYQTERDPKTGTVTIVKAKALPEQIDLNWQTSSGVPPAERVAIILSGSYKGSPVVIPIKDAIPRTGDHYTIPLHQLVDDLFTAIKNNFPLAFDPEAGITLDGPVAVMVAPFLDNAPVAFPFPANRLGTYVEAANQLTITLKRVLGDLDAYIALTKIKPIAPHPTTPSHSAASSSSRCPRCGSAGDSIVCPAPTAWACTPTTPVVQNCPAPAYTPISVTYTSILTQHKKRTCWP